MQKLISEEYCKIQNQMHKEKDGFGNSSKRYVAHVMGLSRELNSNDILDYGCGKGQLQQNLPYTIKQYDPAIMVHSLDPDPADIVVCGDVLEHVEPEYLDNVINHIALKTKVVAFFVINGQESKKHLPDGRNAHLIVETGNWWFNKISECFTINSYTRNYGEHTDGKILQEYIMLASPIGENRNG